MDGIYTHAWACRLMYHDGNVVLAKALALRVPVCGFLRSALSGFQCHRSVRLNLRLLRHRHTVLARLYAACFLVFAVNDLREIVDVHVWLIRIKAMVFIAILELRHHLKHEYCPRHRAL